MKARVYLGLTAGAVLIGAGVWRLAGSRGGAIPIEKGEADRPASRAAAPAPPVAIELASPEEAIRRSPPVVELPDEQGIVTGTVVDTAGKPVAGAEVRAIGGAESVESDGFGVTARVGGREVARGVCDGDGKFELRIPASRAHDLRATADGFAETLLTDVISGQDVDVVLTRRSSVFGTVRRIDGNAPVVAAHVDLFCIGGLGAEGSVRTDQNGKFVAEGVRAGPLLLLLSPEDAALTFDSFVLKEGERRELNLRVSEGISIVGRVTAADGGGAIANAEIAAGSFRSRRVRTNADGRYELRNVAPQVSRTIVTARAPGYGRYELALDPSAGPVLQADFELARARVVKGRIVSPTGSPVPGALVRAYASRLQESLMRNDDVQAWTGENGEFRLDDVRTDVFSVLLVRKEGFASGILATIPRDPAGDRDLGVLAIPTSASLSGKVTTPEGRPVPAFLYLKPRECGHLERCPLERGVRADSRGNFHFRDLPPGDFSLDVSSDGIPSAEDQPVSLAEGEQRTGFEILIGGGKSIRGSVMDPDGHPVEGALVLLSGPEDAEARTNPDGSFRFEGLREETYPISASFETASAEPELIDSPTVQVKAGTRDLVLRLRASAILRGRVVDPEGAPVVPAEVMAVDSRGDWSEETCVDSNGAFAIRVPAGDPIEVRAWHRECTPDPPGKVTFRLGGRDQDPAQASLKNLHGGDAGVLLTIRP